MPDHIVTGEIPDISSERVGYRVKGVMVFASQKTDVPLSEERLSDLESNPSFMARVASGEIVIDGGETAPSLPKIKLVFTVDEVNSLKAHLKADGSTAPCIFTFGDGLPDHDSDNCMVSHTYTSAGTYTSSVIDDADKMASVTFTLVAPPDPTVIR